MNTSHIKSDKKGFTLIELLIAMAITGIVAGAIFTAFQSQQKSYLIQDQVTEMQQNLRAGMDLMVREIRMAGYNPGRINPPPTINAANSNSLTFQRDDGDGNNTVDTYIYSYDSNASTLDRNLNGGGGQPASENIEEIEFYYTLADGTNATAPATADYSKIRSVQIAILARAEHDDSKFSNTKTYLPPSGANWGPYNDGFRRRLLSTTVKCRNMGI